MQNRRRALVQLIWACAVLAPLNMCFAQEGAPPDPAAQGEAQPTAEEIAEAAQAEAQAAEQAAAEAEKEAEAEIKAIARQFETVVAPDAPIRKLQLMLRPMRQADLHKSIRILVGYWKIYTKRSA